MRNPYSWLLFSLVAFDTIVTLVGIKYFGAIEANPFMAWMIAKSTFLFISCKLGTAGVFIYLVERSGKLGYVRFAFWTYLLIYATCTLSLNVPAHATPTRVAHKQNHTWRTAVVTTYADKFEGRPMANRRRFHQKNHVAACRAGRLGSRIELCYGRAGRSVVELTDRGSLPLHNPRRWQFDVSRRVAKDLGLYDRRYGRNVRWRYLK
jgi:hypothetical protein